MRRFRHDDPAFAAAFTAFVNERRETPEEVDAVVRDVLAAVRAEGVTALLRYARDFDRVDLTEATLPIYIWGQLRFAAKLPGVLALGTLLLLASFVLMTIAEILRRRAARRTQNEGGLYA